MTTTQSSIIFKWRPPKANLQILIALQCKMLESIAIISILPKQTVISFKLTMNTDIENTWTY